MVRLYGFAVADFAVADFSVVAELGATVDGLALGGAESGRLAPVSSAD